MIIGTLNLKPEFKELIQSNLPAEISLHEVQSVADANHCQALIIQGNSTEENQFKDLALPLVGIDRDSADEAFLFQWNTGMDPLQLSEEVGALLGKCSNWDPKILVVDDNELVLDSVCAILEDDFEVRGTQSAREGLNLVSSLDYDILITDLMMEEMHGHDFAREAIKRQHDIKVIVMTGYSSKEAAIDSLKVGVFDYLEKPLSPEMVLEAIERAKVDIERDRARSHGLEQGFSGAFELPDSDEQQMQVQILEESELIDTLLEKSGISSPDGFKVSLKDLFPNCEPFLDIGINTVKFQSPRLFRQSLIKILERLASRGGVEKTMGSESLVLKWSIDFDDSSMAEILYEVLAGRTNEEKAGELGLLFSDMVRLLGDVEMDCQCHENVLEIQLTFLTEPGE